MKEVLVIVIKNGTKYQIGIEKSVAEVLKEIKDCKNDFYEVIEHCAIRTDQIVSVEKFEYDPEEVEQAD